MKKLHFFLGLFALAFFLNTAYAQSIPEKTKTKGQMIQLQPLGQTEYTVKTDDRLYIGLSAHGSVGYSNEVRIDNTDVLIIEKKEYVYKDKEKAKMPGGDAAVEKFLFKPLKKGTAEIKVINYFRGSVENETIYTITVE